MRDFSSYTSVGITGSIAYDEIMNFPGQFKDHFHPEKLHQINVSFVVDKLAKHLGGTATNIAFNTSISTKSKVSVFGAMGKDHMDLTRMFDAKKIDYSGSIIDNKLYTSTGKVMTDMSDNQIWGYYYGAGARGKDIDFVKYTNDKTFFVISANHKDAFLHVQNHCIQNNRAYVYDPGMSLTFISDQDLDEGIRSATFIVGNDYEVAQIERRLGISILKIMHEDSGLITTLGSKGVKYQSGENTDIVSGYAVDKVVDPTGAGDAWRGGFIGGLLEGDSLEKSLKIGNALASFAIQQVGTVNHSPTMEEVLSRAETLEISH
ncbi:hypothetical protein COU87_05385 [Candidatus Roizmanbacteria bacterium CG10_big_fil_rev_8_21_14_0_10_39_12]|uniref:Carbohydrate kinase PfkB domain-containing protein n=1 Tax=Candidatus Roizmanbacteria bacterium CG10_big_fil_rev_8_21_14_0_10_39_12 TaxID=1974852 RepID=A0A2M8KN03_9BACT|nr:MAG: hypothetical protein COU87_05385 [Candidatus Roizmanbacteria bacterium CG10_big_fil_rev_8_21_14_0_10_39_12]